METQATSSAPIHPLAWVAGIAVIVFSAVGIGALMGWIPNSIGGAADRPVLEAAPVPTAQVAPRAQAAPKATPKAAPMAPLAQAPAAPQAQAPAPARQSAPRVQPDPVPASAPVVMASARCSECGTIESIRAVETKGAGSGLGVVGGAVAGGLLGSQVGGGRGQDVMTVVGAVGGGFAGNEVEKRMKSTKSYSITVRMEDGTSRSVSETAAPAWQTGQKVRIVNGAIQSNS